eukprot:9310552-Pyramimonas_sp.AAC.1
MSVPPAPAMRGSHKGRAASCHMAPRLASLCGLPPPGAGAPWCPPLSRCAGDVYFRQSGPPSAQYAVL